MQRVAAHVRRGARGRKWIEERERARPLLRLVLSAWAAGTRSGQAGRPWCAPQLSDAAWQAQRAKETRRASRARRLNEAAQRLVMFGRLLFAPHLRDKKRQARLQALLALAKRRAVAQKQWSIVRAAVGRAQQRARAPGARQRRGSTAWRAAFSLEQAAMQAAARARRQMKATVAPRRAGPTRLHRVSAIGSTLHQQLDARLPTAFGDG